MSTPTEDERSFRRSLRDALGFAYRHSLALVIVSVCWVVASLPIITCGLTTLGAYAAIRSLHSHGTVKPSEIWRTVSRHGLNASLLTYVPILIGFGTFAYFRVYVQTRSTQYLAIAIGGTYLFLFLSLIVLTTFVVLSDDRSFVDSLSSSYSWVVSNPTRSVPLMFVFSGVMLLGTLSMIGLVVIVPALLFTLHDGVVRDDLLHSLSKA